jgi:hypothetical protein
MDRLQVAVRKAAFEVFLGVNDTERNVLPMRLLRKSTTDVYTKALMHAVAAGRKSDG